MRFPQVQLPILNLFRRVRRRTAGKKHSIVQNDYIISQQSNTGSFFTDIKQVLPRLKEQGKVMTPETPARRIYLTAIFMLLGMTAMACSAKEPARTTTLPPTQSMVKTPTPSPQCLSVDKSTGMSESVRDGAEVSVAWENGVFSGQHELVLLDEQSRAIPDQQQICTSDANTAVLSVNLKQLKRTSLVIRDRETNNAIRLDEVILRPKHTTRLGFVLARAGRSISGQLTGNLGTEPTGKIVELNKDFSIKLGAGGAFSWRLYLNANKLSYS